MRRITSLAAVLVMALVAGACSTMKVDVVAPRTSTTTTTPCPPVGPGADLTNCNLGLRNLAHHDLSGAILKDTNLAYSDLAGANLSNVQFDGTFFTGSSFLGATITDAKFNSTPNANGSYNPNSGTGVGANFTNANLSGSALRDDNLNLSNFTGANLTSVSFEDSSLKGANFIGAKLTNASFVSTVPGGTDLTGANFAFANVSAVSSWKNVTCPDGTNSNRDGDTCVNHLTAG